MIEISTAGAPPVVGQPSRARRASERGVLQLGVGLAAAFLVAAAIAALVPGPWQTSWAAIHLALAGAALVAIGTFMPHFGVTLAGTRPEPVSRRLGGVLCLATGAATAAIAFPSGWLGLAAVGVVLVLGGLALTAWNTFAPLRHTLSRRHPIVQVTYGAALLQLSMGMGIALLFLLEIPQITAAWAQLKPAHAWLNLFGGVSLTIVATLVYLYPTVMAARVRAHPTLAIGVTGILAGPPVVALAAWLDVGWLAAIGAGANSLGAVGLLGYAADVWRRRGRWTTDPGWHRLVIGHMSAGMGWYAVAVTVAAVDVVSRGPAPAGWSIGLLAIPLVAGWAAQVLVGSWSHLVPAVGPGDAAAHAMQRRWLGVASTLRLLAWNAGVAMTWMGLAAEWRAVAVAGAMLLGASVALAVGLVARSLRPA